MAKPSFPVTSEARTRASLEAEFTRAVTTPGLSPLVGREWEALFPRFARYYQQLTRLPRRTRRALQRQWKQSLAALALLLALGQAPALADTIVVDGSTCTLVDAITAANTDNVAGGCLAGSGAETLQLQAGSTHTLATVNNFFVHTPFTFGPTGLPVVTSKITIAGNGSTIERGAGAPDFRLLGVGLGGDLTLQALTLTGGKTSLYGYYSRGAGVANFGGALTITDSTISGNTSGEDGGGVANCGFLMSATVALINSTVSGNTAKAAGGGVMNCVNGTVTVTDSTVSGNTARVGGGVISSGGDALTITNSTVSGNTATHYGGGVVNHNNALTLSNSTVSGNTAASNGGGVYIRYGSTLDLNHTLVSGNTASAGPEVYSATARYCYNGCQSGTVIADNFNLFGLNDDPGVEGFTPGMTDVVPAARVTLVDILVPLANNGGPSETHALVCGSPAVDGVGTGCPPPVTDQRGFPRPVDGDGDTLAVCDIGAFELQANGGSPSCATATPTAGCTVNGVPNQLCTGSCFSDTILGTPGDDVILGLAGNDVLRGSGGADLLCGGDKNDLIEGGPDGDVIDGGAGNDNLKGGDGPDTLNGGAGNDTCNGGSGTDTGANCETQTRIP